MFAKRFLHLFCCLALFGCGGGGSSGATTETPVPVEDSRPIRILPLGDSITSSLAGQASYRYWLEQLLRSNGISFDFVGSQRGVYQAAPRFPDFDQDHEGHWSWRADEILSRLPQWLAAYEPDIVLLHIGTNDIFQGQPAASTAEEIHQIMETIKQILPDTRIVLALVIPSSHRPDGLIELNSYLPGVAAEASTAEIPIFLVDQFTGFDPSSDTVDGIHPNASGEQKLAGNFFAAIAQILSL